MKRLRSVAVIEARWTFYLVLSMGILFSALPAQAERLLIRNGIVLNRPGFGNFSRGSSFFRTRSPGSLRGAPNLALVNGKIFERDPNNPTALRKLGINLASMALRGAVRPGTLSQVAGTLQRLGQFITDPAKRDVFDRFLKANGFEGLTPNDVSVAGPDSGLAGSPVSARGAAQGGFHPSPEAQRSSSSSVSPGGRSVDPGFLTGEGNVSASTCRNMISGMCSGANTGANLDRSVNDQRQNMLREFMRSQGLSRGEFLSAFGSVSGAAKALSRGALGLNVVRSFAGGLGLLRNYLNFLRNQTSEVVSLGETVKREVVAAIQAQPFSQGTKDEMIQKTSRLEFQTVPDITDIRGVIGWLISCGDGFSPGAFAEVGQNRVLICPGLLLGAKALNPANLVNKLRLIAAHEITHHIGADNRLPTLDPSLAFSPLAACFVNNSNGEVRAFQTAEAAADHLAVETLAVKMEREGIRGAQAFELLRTGLQALCRPDPPAAVAARDDHPTNSFRIAEIAGNNARIQRLVCNKEPNFDRPACTTAGRFGVDGNTFLASAQLRNTGAAPPTERHGFSKKDKTSGGSFLDEEGTSDPHAGHTH